MRAQIKLGRIFGVEIGLHYSWLIIALLITLSLAGHFRVHNPEWGDTLSWGAGDHHGVALFRGHRRA